MYTDGGSPDKLYLMIKMMSWFINLCCVTQFESYNKINNLIFKVLS